MAEGAVMTCKRGHLRTPENIDATRNCLACRRLRQASPEGRAVKTRYEATFGGWARTRRYRLKGARETVLEKLEALAKEEQQFLTSLAQAMQTK